MSFISLGLPTWYDQSVILLNQVIGSAQHMVDPSIPGPGETDANGNLVPLPLFASMMLYFNQALLGAGTILFAIMVFIGTMNTASDGQMLGKSWHSMWTPIRLIFGLLFVVPLQSGLCIGQKIVLYAILLGINMGTTVWQQTINQIFNNSAQPPIPTYLNNSITQMVESVFLMQAVQQIAGHLPNQPQGQIVIPINSTYYLPGSGQTPTVPNFVINQISNQMAGDNGICVNLYNGLKAACGNSVSAILNGNIQIGQPSLYSGVKYYFYIGNNFQNLGSTIPSPGNSFVNTNAGTSNSFNPPPAAPSWADGSINVQGQYTFTFPAAPGSTPNSNGQSQPPNCTNPQANIGNIGATTYCHIQSLVNNYVIQQNSCQNPPSGQSSCSMQAMVQTILDAAQANVVISQFDNALGNSAPGSPSAPAYSPSDINSDTNTAQPTNTMQPNAYGAPENTYIDKNSPALDSQGNQLVDSKGNKVYHVLYNLNDYWIPGTSSNPNAKTVPYIDVQLNNSWWEAGSSYLVIDNQLSQSLAELWDQLQTIMNTVQTTGSQGVTAKGVFTASYGMQMIEVGSQASTDTGTPENTTCGLYNYNFIQNGGLGQIGLQDPNANGWPLFSCLSDQIRGTDFLYANTTVQTNDVPPSNWMQLIDPYNPLNTAGSTAGGSSPGGTSGSGAGTPVQEPHIDTHAYPNLYNQLSYIPANLQGPIAILLTAAQMQYQQSIQNGGTADDSMYVNLLPYLQGLMNVFAANGMVQQSGVGSGLPVTAALNEIFNGLLGSDASDPVASINSVMQAVYNLGSPPATPGLVAKQFSLIQQAQTAGISMIMVCITSLEDIVNHYTNQYQALENQMNQFMAGGIAAGVTAGLGAALAAFYPAQGQAIVAAAGVTADVLGLVMQIQTINALTSISMTLMWLPIVMFVLTSLFTAGIQFALIVPLTPYILFWAGQIAWLLGVLEAIVAAPIVMLGLAHPGGHDYMGHSTPAVRMLLGVVFRPVLMVIGMVTGILLTYVVITFSAQGFHTVAASLLNSVPQDDQMVQGILACLMLLVYCSFIVLAFNKCFSTIYLIPDKVMEWVGGHRGDQAGAQDLQQMSSQASQAAGQMAQAGDQGANKDIQAHESKAQQTSQFDQSAVSTSKNSSMNYGEGAGKSLKGKTDSMKGGTDSSTGAGGND